MNDSVIKSALLASFAIIIATPTFAARGDNSEGNGGRNNNTPKDNCIQYKTRQVAYTDYETRQEQRSRVVQVPETYYVTENRVRDEQRTRIVQKPVPYSNFIPAAMTCSIDGSNFADFARPCTYSAAHVDSGVNMVDEEQIYTVQVPYSVQVQKTSMLDVVEYYTAPVTVAVEKTKSETYCARYQTPDRGNSGNR